MNIDDETPLNHSFLNACSLFCIVGTIIKPLLHHYNDLDTINIDDKILYTNPAVSTSIGPLAVTPIYAPQY